MPTCVEVFVGSQRSRLGLALEQRSRPCCLQFWSHHGLVLQSSLEGTYIYMVELSLGTPGCCPLPLPFNFLFF